MKKKTGLYCAVVLVLAGFIGAAGCAGSKTYLLNLSYDASRTPPFWGGGARPLTVAVYQFQDARPDRLYLGRRVYRDGKVDFFKPDSGTVEQVITRSVVKIMERAGFKVILVNRALNPDKESFEEIPGDLALGGKIEALWVEAKSGYTMTDTDARLRLLVIWGLPQDKSWMTKTIEGTASETDRPLYGPKYAEAKINQVLQDGLDKLLKDETALRDKLMKMK